MLALEQELGEPLRTFIHQVYRPYCKAMKRYALSKDSEIDNALNAVVSLCSNVIIEAAHSAAKPEHHVQMCMLLTRNIVEVLQDSFNNPTGRTMQ